MKIKMLDINWSDHAWDVLIRNPRPRGGCRLDREILRLVRSRFEPLALPPDMYRSVSLKSSRPKPGAFTLIELLVVIAIIAILAGILLPTLAIVKTKAKIANTRTEMMSLATAIKAYDNDYHRYPASKLTEQQGANGDFTMGTFGLTLQPGVNSVVNLPTTGHQTNNSEVVLLLLDLDQGINLNHVRNPQKNKYWNGKMVNSDIAGISTVDNVARDPFGNPYIITLDMNDDNKVVDAVYGDPGVAERSPPPDNVGHVGLTRIPAPVNRFELNGPLMIWTFGPDKTFDPGQKAKEGLNKDNILSWSN